MAAFITTNYSMKWQNFHSHLAEEMAKLLRMESMVDVTLKAEGGTFQAHRIVLSACSPYFQTIFATIDPDYHPIIILSDMSANDVRAILDFIYNGEIKIEKTNIQSLLKTAEELKISALKDIKNYLKENPISSTNNSDVELIVKTPPNNTMLPPTRTPKSLTPQKSKSLHLSSPSQGSLTKALISDPGKNKTELPSKKSCEKDLLSHSTKLTVPSFTQSKSNSLFPIRPVSSLSPISPALSSPNKVVTKKSNLPQNASNYISPQKSAPQLETKTNSLLTSTSFSSLDTSWPLSVSKAIYSLEGESLSLDNDKGKPLVEVQTPESLMSTERFNHKNASQFIVLGSYASATGSQARQKTSTMEISNGANANTEVHVLRYEDLEDEIMNKEEYDESWLLLKPETTDDEIKENIVEKNTQVCVVRPDEFFMQSVIDKSQDIQAMTSTLEPQTQQSVRVSLSKDLVGQDLSELELQKNSVTKLSQNLNVPRSTLYYRARRAGVNIFYPKDYSADMNQKMIDATNMVKEGSTLKEACVKFGVTRTALWRRVNKELGPGALTLRSQLKCRYTKFEMDKALAELKAGVNLGKVSKKYNIPPATLHRVQSRLIDMGLLRKEITQKAHYDKDGTKQERLLAALNDVFKKRMAITQAALEYNIPKATLWRKVTWLNKNLPMNIVECNIEELTENHLDMEDDDDDDQMYSMEYTDEELKQIQRFTDTEAKSKFILPNDYARLEGSQITACDGEESEQSFVFRTEDEEEEMESVDDPYILVTDDMCMKI